MQKNIIGNETYIAYYKDLLLLYYLDYILLDWITWNVTSMLEMNIINLITGNMYRKSFYLACCCRFIITVVLTLKGWLEKIFFSDNFFVHLVLTIL